eukprot:CAMPEP_0113696830 /NCGR_PEP_ID=MMETSP0038_2-20120614/21753_1 /TAXON_ID=2898 /ORGANISM="Cryptomonas paramecium" /LENGTH=44 /DNA_ID=CAMNT_0000619687 /DNA_START=391 /DNA_END=522 /DNA_ORIENTATION=- /assembly_acc=CAM_ASM_000170
MTNTLRSVEYSHSDSISSPLVAIRPYPAHRPGHSWNSSSTSPAS